MPHANFLDIHRELHFAELQRQNEARKLWLDLMRLRRIYATNHGLLRAFRQMLRNRARLMQERYPRVTVPGLERRIAQLKAIAGAPLPWVEDPDWRNPMSTETYTACGYADALEADREQAGHEADELAGWLAVQETRVKAGTSLMRR